MVNKRLTSIETSLVSLRKQQKLKVDELKKNTAYYSTKSLIDRYDPTSPEKKILDEQKRRKLAQEKEEEKRRKGTYKSSVFFMNKLLKYFYYN